MSKEVAHFNREQFAKDFAALHGVYERKAYKVFRKALQEQVQPVVTYLNNYGIPSSELVTVLVSKTPMQAAYKEVYTTVGVKHAATTYRNINALGRSMKSVSFFSETWRALMEAFFTNESAYRISEVTQTTRDRVQKLLADNADLSISQLATLLESMDFARPRALTIARTESTAAANYGASVGNRDADYETNKEWVSVLDSRTRKDHMVADGQVVDNEGLFTIGNEKCRFPGDLTLSAKEVINCRCVVAYVPILDLNGLPLLKN